MESFVLAAIDFVFGLWMLVDCFWKRSKARQRDKSITTRFLCKRMVHKNKTTKFETESLFLPTNTHY